MRFHRISLEVVRQMAAEVLRVFEVVDTISTSENCLRRDLVSGVCQMHAVLFGAIAMLFVMVA